MVYEIVQNLSFSIPEDKICKFSAFYTLKNQIPGCENYSFYFIETFDGNIQINLWIDCPKPVDVVCDITVNSVTKTIADTFKEFSSRICNFGRKSDLIVNGFLSVHAKLNFKMISETIVAVEKKQFYAAQLLDNERFKDFTICVEKKEIKVHKCVLSAASLVFDAMLQPHCKEFQENMVEITDFDVQTVKAGVELMYGKEPDDNLSSLLKLCKFADKYDLTNGVSL
uniref:BTB domain-containing protein n=2 Tax=Panagrolaimus sp. JU765 TaxID=591449 RepID=A0AC34QB47_9BILA